LIPTKNSLYYWRYFILSKLLSQWAKSSKKTVWSLLFIRHSKYSAVLSKIYSYSLLFRRFCPPGSCFFVSLWDICKFAPIRKHHVKISDRLLLSIQSEILFAQRWNLWKNAGYWKK